MDEKNKKSTRRDFLKKSGYTAGGVIGGGLLGGVLGNQFFNDDKETDQKPSTQHDQALQYFTDKQKFQILADATERIFPENENGPGAIELGVPYFIDHQLASIWGVNGKVYMQGPFYEGQPNQGYQTPLKRHQIFDVGIEAISKESKSTFDETFTSLEGDQQDQILEAFEKNEVKMKGVSSNEFFELLRSTTIEGVYADPLYGGNKNMAGWKMKQYPGVHMNFTDQIESEEFIDIEQKSLHDTHN